MCTKYDDCALQRVLTFVVALLDVAVSRCVVVSVLRCCVGVRPLLVSGSRLFSRVLTSTGSSLPTAPRTRTTPFQE